MTTTTQQSAIEQAEAHAFFSVTAPTGSQWFDPHEMTMRQRAVIMSTLGEPGSPIHATDQAYWANIIDHLQNENPLGTNVVIPDGTRERFSKRIIEGVFATVERLGIHVLIDSDTPWPQGLNDLGEHRPLALYVLGNPWRLTDNGVSIVGSRAATGYGEHVTMEMTSALADRGYTIVSGGAYGIDGMAHRAALAGGSATIAYLAGGVDRLYPVGHETMLRRVMEQGAVVSELPPGSAPTKWRFLQRNRLVAAHTDGTVVVEAGVRSGSLNTAGHAKALGRHVMAVPGAITSPASAGCHRLIREEGATLVTTADDVIAVLGSGE